MGEQASHDVSRILEAIAAGDERASDELYSVVYDELRRIARSLMAKERGDHTLQATAVVNEAYMRLVGTQPAHWQNRAHFFGAAAEAMRRLLVDHSRRKLSLKRGGEWQRVELSDYAESETSPEQILTLDETLRRLEARDATMAKVVELRYFAGMSLEETAVLLGISVRSVNRSWTAARAWLRRELDRAGASETARLQDAAAGSEGARRGNDC